jgi:hypothetical protein
MEKSITQKTGLPQKCLIGIPERIMLAMIDDGWILRNKLVWHKPNHMPSSIKDRFSSSWEYLYFFVKQPRYWFDLDAVRVPHKFGQRARFNIRVRDMQKGRVKGPQWKASDWEVEEYDEKAMMHRVKEDDRLKKDHLSRPPEPEVDPERAFNPAGKNPSDVWESKSKHVGTELEANYVGTGRNKNIDLMKAAGMVRSEKSTALGIDLAGKNPSETI